MVNVSFFNIDLFMFVRENGLISFTDMYDYFYFINIGY